MRESRLTYGNRRLLKVRQHSRLFNRYGRGEHYFPLSKTSFIESEVKPMKSRCAPMSAEYRQAHHLFISHHCRITARCLRRLVGRFVVLGIITKPSLFPSRIRPIGHISPICHSDTLCHPENSLLFRNLCPFLLVLPFLPIRKHISSRNSECPFHHSETRSILMPLRNFAVALASLAT